MLALMGSIQYSSFKLTNAKMQFQIVLTICGKERLQLKNNFWGG